MNNIRNREKFLSNIKEKDSEYLTGTETLYERTGIESFFSNMEKAYYKYEVREEKKEFLENSFKQLIKLIIKEEYLCSSEELNTSTHDVYIPDKNVRFPSILSDYHFLTSDCADFLTSNVKDKYSEDLSSVFESIFENKDELISMKDLSMFCKSVENLPDSCGLRQESFKGKSLKVFLEIPQKTMGDKFEAPDGYEIYFDYVGSGEVPEKKRYVIVDRFCEDYDVIRRERFCRLVSLSQDIIELSEYCVSRLENQINILDEVIDEIYDKFGCELVSVEI